MRHIILLFVFALGFSSWATEPDMVTYLDAPKPFAGPQSFKDEISGIAFYVESDGRHVAAIDSSGKLLWVRDPFVDGKLEAYRFERPVIVTIGLASIERLNVPAGRYIHITFNSSQFGIMRISSGEFIFLGQD